MVVFVSSPVDDDDQWRRQVMITTGCGRRPLAAAVKKNIKHPFRNCSYNILLRKITSV